MQNSLSQFALKSLLLPGLFGLLQMAHAIPDGQDSIELACPQASAQTTPTLVLRGCDSGVKNRAWKDCTIADLLMQCELEKPEFRNRCIAKTTNTLVQLGIIDGQEKGEIQLCADPSDSELGDIHHRDSGNK
jgi:hypothetical protein